MGAVDPWGLKSMKDMDCAELVKEINKWRNHVSRRRRQMEEDAGKLWDKYRKERKEQLKWEKYICCSDLSVVCQVSCSDMDLCMADSWKGAEEAYKNAQQHLRDLLYEFSHGKNCHKKGYKVPGDSWKVATRPAPARPYGHRPSNMVPCPIPWPSFPLPVPAPVPAPIKIPVPAFGVA